MTQRGKDEEDAAREARFLASQATRDQRRKQRSHDRDAGRKVKLGEFWDGLRAECATLHSRLDTLLCGDSGGREGKENAGVVVDNDVATGEHGGCVGDCHPTRPVATATAALFVTAAQRNKGQAELDSISSVVRLLQKHCLSSSSSSSASAVVSPDGTAPVDPARLPPLLRWPIPDLPQTDVRLIGEELAKLQSRVDAARPVVCPKEKFVFRRYRRALAERESLQMDEEKAVKDEAGLGSADKDDVDDDDTGRTSAECGREESRSNDSASGISPQDFGGVLDAKTDCDIVVEYTGAITYRNKTKASMGDVPNPSSHFPCQISGVAGGIDSLTPSKDASSFLIQKLSNCRVILKGLYKSVHIIGCVDGCTIDIVAPITGSIHVTSCHHMTLQSASSQLRVHDCTNANFHIFVKSGPIIENCSGMKFFGDFFSRRGDASDGSGCNAALRDEENLYHDVKDFNWLRNLVKSPNFDVYERGTAVGLGTDLAGVGSVQTQSIDAQPSSADGVHIVETTESSGEEDEI